MVWYINQMKLKITVAIWIVEYENGTKSIHILAHFRLTDNEMNQFHVNVSRERLPRIARIIILGVVAAEKSINLGSDNLTYTINGY